MRAQLQSAPMEGSRSSNWWERLATGSDNQTDARHANEPPANALENMTLAAAASADHVAARDPSDLPVCAPKNALYKDKGYWIWLVQVHF